MKLVLENVKKSYVSNKYVLKGANYQFETGKIYALLGRNGAGKTTLFDCINNNIPFEGKIYFEDENKKDKVTINDVGYSVAEPSVPEFLTGREFLQFFIEINKERIKDLKTPEEYFDLLFLDRKDLDKLLKDYSFGMKNKLQMLINMIIDSKVLLLDEPLTSLDVVAQEEMKKLLKDNKEGHVLIFSTHIMELAFDLCDEIILLSDGVITEVNSEMKNNKEYILNLLKEEGKDNEND